MQLAIPFGTDLLRALARLLPEAAAGMARPPTGASSMLAAQRDTGDPGLGVAMFLTGRDLVEFIEWPSYSIALSQGG
jgi:hypothetical protein